MSLDPENGTSDEFRLKNKQELLLKCMKMMKGDYQKKEQKQIEFNNHKSIREIRQEQDK